MIGRIRREGDWYVAKCLGLPVTTQGETDSEAMGNLIEATQLFIESCLERGTLEQVLLKHKWRLSAKPPQDLDSGRFALPIRVLPVVAKHALECRA